MLDYVRLAGDHLNEKLLFTLLSLVMSMTVSFCAALFPRDVLDEILDLIRSASEGLLPTLTPNTVYIYANKLQSNKCLVAKVHSFELFDESLTL